MAEGPCGGGNGEGFIVFSLLSYIIYGILSFDFTGWGFGFRLGSEP
jgi:hypothetical protein